jgi:hypothetical protein
MEYEVIAKQAGCLPEAAEDIVRRCEGKFQGETPSPEAVKAWLTETLKPQAAHLFPQAQTLAARLGLSEEAFSRMPPAWRLEQARTHQPPMRAPHPRRPWPKDAPADVQEKWKGLSLTERMTAYRAWRDSQS